MKLKGYRFKLNIKYVSERNKTYKQEQFVHAGLLNRNNGNFNPCFGKAPKTSEAFSLFYTEISDSDM